MDPAADALRTWVVDMQPTPLVPNQSRREFGRTLRSADSIDAEAVVLRVAAHRLLSASAAKKTESLIPLLKKAMPVDEPVEHLKEPTEPTLMDHWDDHLALCLLLMHAKANPLATPYKPYIDCLPSRFSNLLCLETWNPKALERLKGTIVEAVMENERSQMELVLIHVLMPAIKLFPGVILKVAGKPSDAVLQKRLWADLMWAHAAIASRAFTFRMEKSSEQSEVFMVPFLDLANHSNTPNLVVKGVEESTQCLLVKAKRNIEKGEELTIAYHDGAPNWFLLTHYGFAIQNNPQETVQVTFDDGNEEEDEQAMALKEQKESLLQIAATELGLPLGRDQEFGPAPPIDSKPSSPEEAGIPSNMIMSLRILVANDQDLRTVSNETISAKIQEPLSSENEEKVFEMVDLMAQTLLGMYPSSYEDDVKRRAEKDEGGDERFILDYLIGQKRILKSVISWCTKKR
ncbi:hypothetical protein HDU79_009410 [Rhizoclosmatium sp. JEL0117]|nr:hypothetical protein HDU79_009410 [Rhizoclosmatium sp. JEL0117]